MPVKTVTAPQVTFRQATRSVSNENGLCQARHRARVDLVCLVCFFFHIKMKDDCTSPNCLAVFITDCKRFGLPCRSSVFALVCGMIAILISIFK